ncbi:MAG: peptide deformylase [Oscillospiraceae bacterium]|nr:peptide deformylase [Oscillospiraceae bacterium]
MAIRKIREEGDALLLKKSRPVTEFNPRLHELIDDMRDTLLNAGGVGLAAPQVGVLRRVVLVMDTLKEELSDEEQIIELVNPEIIERDGTQTDPEGCLSVPGVYGLVERPYHVRVRAQDRFGKTFEVEGEELTARCFCHEIDHLDGHLFTELATRILSDEELEEYRNKQREKEN